MRVHFWSSTEYSGFLEALVHELTRIGIPAKQRFQVSEASYRSAKKVSERLCLRLRQYLFYPIQLCISLIWERFGSRFLGVLSRGNRSDAEAVVVSTNTFYAPLLATLVHPNVVHLVYDLFPEAMIHSGKWKEGTVKVRLVRWITRQTLKRAKQNVFLGQRLKDHVVSIHGTIPNAVIIPVGADQALFGRSPALRGQKSEDSSQRAEARGHRAEVRGQNETNADSNVKLERKSSPTILYCGNFGNMHDSETLFTYWAGRTVTDVLEFKFHCSGPKRALLEAEYSELPEALKEQIFLGDGLGQAEWIRTMEAADVALVTMVPGSETVVMPSKTYSAMMAGQAILAIAPEESDLVDLIKDADCGWFVEPGDVEGLEAALQAISSDAEGLLEKRENAFAYAHQHFGQDALAKEWRSLCRS